MQNLDLRCPIMACPLPNLRGVAITINRGLAWALLIMPWLHAVFGTPYWRGFWYDMGLLAMHGLLSMALFGTPKVAPADRTLMWLGISPARMTPRTDFLFTGFGIAAALLYLLAYFWLFTDTFLIALAWVVGLHLAYLWMLLPFRLIDHVHKAAEYATARWRVRKAHLRRDWAALVVLVYLAGHIVNIVVALGRSMPGTR